MFIATMEAFGCELLCVAETEARALGELDRQALAYASSTDEPWSLEDWRRVKDTDELPTGYFGAWVYDLSKHDGLSVFWDGEKIASIGRALTEAERLASAQQADMPQGTFRNVADLRTLPAGDYADSDPV